MLEKKYKIIHQYSLMTYRHMLNRVSLCITKTTDINMSVVFVGLNLFKYHRHRSVHLAFHLLPS